MTLNAKPMRTKDQVPFTCRRCGACCRDLGDRLMVEPLDVYQLGCFLIKRDFSICGVEDVYARFTHITMLNEILPIFLMNTSGEDHSCVFLEDGKCKVYEARPRACRIYPFTVDVGNHGKRFMFYQGIDDHASHFTGSRVNVGDWMYQNFTREARDFVEQEGTFLPELGRLLRRMDETGRRRFLFQMMFYRYYNYDLKQPFLPQYRENSHDLLAVLRKELNTEE